MDRRELAAGVLVGYRFGRTDSNPGLTGTNTTAMRVWAVWRMSVELSMRAWRGM